MNKEENDILVELLTLQKEVQKVDRHIYNNYKKKIYKLEKRIDKAIEFIDNELLPFGDEWHWDNAAIEDLVVELRTKLRGEDNE